jgi:hypothetical protein
MDEKELMHAAVDAVLAGDHESLMILRWLVEMLKARVQTPH